MNRDHPLNHFTQTSIDNHTLDDKSDTRLTVDYFVSIIIQNSIDTCFGIPVKLISDHEAIAIAQFVYAVNHPKHRFPRDPYKHKH